MDAGILGKSLSRARRVCHSEFSGLEFVSTP